ncbi:hypothetical protein [Nitrosomonas sp. Nm58]|uniref:hypothetical protein n=1 Tax=Nitrosomonas sp. Nm58 TaxID=200126 RepID=UPI000B88A90D|nr:hypothetical protein [Nitrosomonas sp. Nm58]
MSCVVAPSSTYLLAFFVSVAKKGGKGGEGGEGRSLGISGGQHGKAGTPPSPPFPPFLAISTKTSAPLATCRQRHLQNPVQRNGYIKCF